MNILENAESVVLGAVRLFFKDTGMEVVKSDDFGRYSSQQPVADEGGAPVTAADAHTVSGLGADPSPGVLLCL